MGRNRVFDSTCGAFLDRLGQAESLDKRKVKAAALSKARALELDIKSCLLGVEIKLMTRATPWGWL